MRLAGAMRRLMLHTYTRTPSVRTPGTEDTYYQAQTTPGVAVAGQPCRYFPESRATSDATGALVVEAPVLSVPPSDPLKVGDHVSNILARDGTLLDAGPFVVTDLAVDAPFSDAAKKSATLSAAEATS